MQKENSGSEFNLQSFTVSLEMCNSLELLDAYLKEFAERCGFRWYTLQDVAIPSDAPSQLLRLTNYPEMLWDEYDQNGFARFDPIIKALEYTGRVLVWRDIRDIIDLSKRQTRVLDEAEQAGIQEGVSVSVRLPGQYNGLMTLISDQSVDFPADRRAWMSFIAPIAYEVAARLHTGHSPQQALLDNNLSPRQMECLILVAKGKSDWEAAQILGLSEQTVHRHVEAIRQKLGGRRRAQLVVQALHRGIISYRDVL
ncbi:helix-turn-helix transcriptional regulator [Aestuariibius sp. 2305UL40-4]|uniref:helix-turn-helix transcriptional regulator n=1 Tax=Aestuariibius violaceus TaxID=3234132 RepID=UPI00345E38B1